MVDNVAASNCSCPEERFFTMSRNTMTLLELRGGVGTSSLWQCAFYPLLLQRLAKRFPPFNCDCRALFTLGPDSQQIVTVTPLS